MTKQRKQQQQELQAQITKLQEQIESAKFFGFSTKKEKKELKTLLAQQEKEQAFWAEVEASNKAIFG